MSELNRRDVLKALLLAPVAAIVPGAALAAPVMPERFIAFNHCRIVIDNGVGFDNSAGFIVSETWRRFLLKTPGTVDPLSKQWPLHCFNAGDYEFFRPGELYLSLVESPPGADYTIFHLGNRHISVESIQYGGLVKTHQMHDERRDFGVLPAGEFMEVYVDSAYERYPVDQNGNRIS